MGWTSVDWDGESWAEAERAAEKMVFRSPLFVARSAGFLALHAANRATKSLRHNGIAETRFTERTLATQARVQIDVPPEVVYSRVSDVAGMGRWSPENTGATFPHADGTDIHVGTIFHGHNKRGRLRWTTRCRVTEATPGECFSFDVEAIGPSGKPLIPFSIATWTYRFEPAAADATTVTEEWRIGPYPPAIIAVARRLREDDLDALELQSRNLRITLNNLKRVLEADAAS
ncbi:SRPBCC family protein [Jongsikchunia kroppenstedtii]|uniref:SRPBCC family protein n=1 Tax=Jongsikchunia kroppenstedtii TaxID=1121721 RepID=UPI001C9E0021|nr:SRPBCC family protein [Jongsikchunia kroppenstedtii]